MSEQGLGVSFEATILPIFEQLPQTALFSILERQAHRHRLEGIHCQIEANNDHEAIQCWLNEYRHKETTYRSYQKEAERLLLWALYERQKALSDCTRDDFEAYFEFLNNPLPADRWCSANRPRGSRRCKRGSPEWRPFVGPLSPSAKQTAITIINSMMDYLVEAQYLKFNPLRLIRKKNKQGQSSQTQQFRVWERILEKEEWTALWQTILNLPEQNVEEQSEKARIRFLVAILYFLGLRIHELAEHTFSAFKKVRGQWWFFVKGKGDKLGKIPVNDPLLAELKRFRTFLGYTPYPEFQENSPLIPSFRSKSGLSTRHMNHLLKKLAKQAANCFPNEPDRQAKLYKFSAHWLRHLSASMQDEAGILFKHIQSNHRHQSEETTRRYVHAFDQDRHDDMQKLKLPEQ